jgi:hypothetical protein
MLQDRASIVFSFLDSLNAPTVRRTLTKAIMNYVIEKAAKPATMNSEARHPSLSTYRTPGRGPIAPASVVTRIVVGDIRVGNVRD